MTLGSMDILTMLIQITHEHEISFYLFISSLISFTKVLVFSVKVFTSLVKFIPKYFIVSDTIVNGIVFFISFSDNWLLMYRNVTNFCMLIVYSLFFFFSFLEGNEGWTGEILSSPCLVNSCSSFKDEFRHHLHQFPDLLGVCWVPPHGLQVPPLGLEKQLQVMNRENARASL